MDRTRGISEVLAREATVVNRVVFTFLGGAISFIFVTPPLAFLIIIARSIMPFVPYAIFFPVALVVFGLAAFALLVLYSALVSQLLYSFVSPMDIELVAIALLLIHESQPVVSSALSEDFTPLVTVVLGSLVLFLLGIFGELLSKWIVGLGQEGRHQATFEINASLESVDRLLKTKVVSGPLELTKRKLLEQGKLILHQNANLDFYAFIAEKPENSRSSLVHLEGYRYTRYAIEANSEESAGIFGMRVGYIESVLRSASLKLDRVSDDSFPFSKQATGIALAPTTSKLQGLPRLRWPRQTLAIIVGLTFLVFAAYAYTQSGQISRAEALSAIVGIASIVAALIPQIKGPTKEMDSESE